MRRNDPLFFCRLQTFLPGPLSRSERECRGNGQRCKPAIARISFVYGFLGTFFIFAALLPLCASAASTISGDLSAFSITPASNPYFVDKDLLVPEGTTVTIPQGCIFLFSPFTGIKIDGTLIALGSADTPVVFTSINDTSFNRTSMRKAEPFDWNGIVVDRTSHDSQIRHCIVSYSVYGIKSQIRDIVIDNTLFHANGQFHLTIRDSIVDVKDNTPFSFGNDATVIRAQVPSDILPSASPEPPPPPPPPVTSGPAFYKSIPFRIATLCAGVAGAGAGIYYAVDATKHRQVLEEISSGTALRDKDRWNTEMELKQQSAGRCVAGFVVAGIGIAAFGISFPLPDRLFGGRQRPASMVSPPLRRMHCR